MASSDDEEEVVVKSVTNYFFVDAKEEPISFSVLPVWFDGMENPDAPEEQVFLHGNGDGGLQKVYKQVTAWKLGLEDALPEVMVFTRDSKWIKLLKPRKSYEDSIRTIFITIQLLHFLRRKPESSEKSLWEHLCKIFSTFEERPSVNDLTNHYPLVKLFVERDEALAKSEMLLTLLKERPRNKAFGVDLQCDSDPKKSFIVDELEEDMANEDGDESEEEPDLFDSVCAICDNGGEILCCEGRCMRSFHATRKDGEDSDCKSLGFSKAQVDAIQSFLCRNCKYKRHQCFVCGKLGCSDKSKGAEVFACANATCGYFYHPKCVADLLFQENRIEAADYEKKIAGGESFTCPVHRCHVCKQGENKEDKELQFAVCRRCPKSYHRKCLPRKIAFDDIEEEGIIQRAWEDLLPNRILIYCLKHKIDDELGTPMRNHIIFPELPEKQKVVDVQKNKVKTLLKKKRQISEDLSQQRTSIKPTKATEKILSSEDVQPAARSGKNITQQLNLQKQSRPSKVDGLAPLDGKKALKERANAAVPTISSKVLISSYPKINAEIEKKLKAFMEETTSSITLRHILQKRTMPSTYTPGSRNIDRSITLGKIEVSVEAVKTALDKLEAGGKVEDAKVVCEPDVIKQIKKWSNKLKVYLAPFLHGKRYSSFGRHFTKVDKLKQIVDRLQWYVQNGDMIVDFCCGANDFSRLMKEKLDSSGKKCSYKNYDIIQPKYDFNFEKRDWMSVRPNELPTGSQLIMGLNPPFGLNASLANKFIDKALTFKPKLVILIVPPETERLDRKRTPYDLVWEDAEELAGKSFYLPGSIDQNDMQIEQWNNVVPPLYLWSRPDWTGRHKAIAMNQCHVSQPHRRPPVLGVPQPLKLDVHPSRADVATRHADKEVTTAELSAREGNQRISEDSKKRSPPEIHINHSAKRKKVKKMMQKGEKSKEMEESEARKVADWKEGNRSDMSISPVRSREPSRDFPRGQRPLETFETPRESFRTSTERPNDSKSGLSFGSMEGIDDMARRYATPSGSQGWSGDRLGNTDPMLRNSEERYSSGYNGLDSLRTSSYADGYGRSLDADSRTLQSRPYREDDYLQRARFSSGIPGGSVGQGDMFPPTYGLSSSTPGSGSVMQRYAPQLDEMNHARGDSFGFGSGSQHQYKPPGSGGWLGD